MKCPICKEECYLHAGHDAIRIEKQWVGVYCPNHGEVGSVEVAICPRWNTFILHDDTVTQMMSEESG